MEEIFSRTELLLGSEAMAKLKKSRVCIFGIGGVGGHAAEALVRSGIGEIDLVDNDVISKSNINRQLFALNSTVGRQKTDAAEERLRDINPEIKINKHNVFYLPENAELFDFSEYDYVIDAVDTVSAKIDIILKAKEAGARVISAMGAGNKLCAHKLEVSDIYSTSVCPLARVMRHEMRKRGITDLKVVYSKEEPLKPENKIFGMNGKPIPGSVAFVPPVAGLIIAGEVIADLIRE